MIDMPMLTKSRFKIGLQCPRKLSYECDPEYVNQDQFNSQLSLLSEEGMKIGEYAKLLFPNGIEVLSLNPEDALAETEKLLMLNDVVIFEAAIKYQDFFIRIDVLEKIGATVNLYEVKSKSYDLQTDEFISKKGKIKPSWKMHLYDVAFQKYILENALVTSKISAYLTVIDKTSIAAENGINGWFEITEKGSSKKAVFKSGMKPSKDALRHLLHVNVDNEYEYIKSLDSHFFFNELSFTEVLTYLRDVVKGDLIPEPLIKSSCSSCQFHTKDTGGSDGRLECLNLSFPNQNLQPRESLIFDLWNYRGMQSLIDNEVLRLSDISERVFDGPNYEPGTGLSVLQRQKIQWEKVRSNDDSPFVDSLGLSKSMSKWVFPLHFIDFETSRGSLPYFKRQKPNDLVAFQFSHHVIKSNGDIEHNGQFLDVSTTANPNLSFIRELKSQLSIDNGSIFSFSDFEMQCLRNLSDDAAICGAEDAKEIQSFIKSLIDTHSPRALVDLLQVYKSFVYLPRTKGSNSIKDVLPAILNDSELLQTFYGDRIYGSEGRVKSLNFTKPISWLQMEGGEVIDPYSLLPILDEVPEGMMKVKNGGAAPAAYSLLQSGRLDGPQREYLKNSLLQYCELDTLAMVMIYQYFCEVCGQ